MSSNEVRKRREEQQVEIRRQKREENLAKRRNLYTSETAGQDSDDEGGGAEWEAQGANLAQGVFSGDLAQQIEATARIRRLLSKEDNPPIEQVIRAGLIPAFVEFLKSPDQQLQVQTPALRCIGNIVTGDDLQTQVVIASGALPALLPIFRSHREGLRKEACWTVSNILAGTTKQIQSIVDAGLWPELVNCMSSAEPRTRREACWAVSNATSGASPDQIAYFVDQNTLGPLCAMLSMMDNRIIKITLEALDNILKNGELIKIAMGTGAANPYATIVEEVGGMVAIHNLQTHDNNEIYTISYRIMETYFVDEEDDVPISNADEGFKMQRADAPDSGFNFGGTWGA
ncbi:Importin alpha subunit (Karyopherin alpha subunit) (Serine-rich RNA polymerase I suppressor protein) [Serendipita sp. 399]|nr:Importin alpha subunit (Karyopherin alpha subunit) (Serine-rich RNA polymerase I suppressor protein) [Serendipita sp. 399]